jgi:hypothetical protein
METVGIAHQYKIREQKSQEGSNSLFGNYWENLNLSLKDAVVKRIDRDTAENIILEYEWLGTMSNTMFHYGIFFDGVCGGVVCYGKNCTANFNVPHEFGVEMDELLTLARGACVHWTPKGSASKLIAQSLQLAKQDWPKAKVVIAYSDTDAGEIGTVYQATNWYYIGRGDHKTFNLVNKQLNKQIDERYLHDLKIKWKCKRGEAKQRLLDEGWEVQFKSVKHKYIFILGNRKERKQILSKISVLEYPKRDPNAHQRGKFQE